MFKLRVNGIIAGAAFLLSFLLGLLSGSHMPMLFIRPVIFAVLFFIISGIVSFLVNQFLPELLEETGPDKAKEFIPGSRIDITEEDNPGDTLNFIRENSPVLPGRSSLGAQPDDSEVGLGNISDLLTTKMTAKGGAREGAGEGTNGGTPTGLDQEAQDGYNKREELEVFPETGLSFPGESLSGEKTSPRETESSKETIYASNGGSPDSADILPDLDSMAGAFLPASINEESDTTEYSISTPSQKPLSKAKTPGWTGDFNAKDLASGLRTILSKEKEG